MSSHGKKFLFKITVIGDGMVGKTSLISKFTKGTFNKDYIKTIGAQFSTFDKEVNDDKIRLLFWDIAGQLDFNFVWSSFFNRSRAAIIVYSLEANDLGKISFKHIEDWYNDIKKYCGEIPVIIFANKVDLLDNYSFDDSELLDLVEKHNFFGYYITSAKTGQGVIQAFDAVIEALYKKFKALSLIEE